MGKHKHSRKPKPVNQLSIDGKFIKRFGSASEASKVTGADAGNITRVCQGKAKTANGSIWEYAKTKSQPKKPVLKTSGNELAKLADEMLAVVNKYCVMSEGYAEIVVLWCLGTYFIKDIQYFPRLVLTSPIPQCGKSQVLKVIKALTKGATYEGAITQAALIRVIDQKRIKIIILEEVDEAIDKGGDFTQIINNGVERGTTFTVCDPNKTKEVIRRKVFKPMVLGGIAITDKLTEASLERSIVLTLQKEEGIEITSIEGESIKRSYLKLKGKLAKAVKATEYVTTKPPLLSDNRAISVWKPLYSVAHMLGGEWITKVELSYKEFTSVAKDDPNNVALLKRVNGLWDELPIFKSIDQEWLTIVDLVECLNEDSDYDNISPKKVASLLRTFDIKPRQKRKDSRSNPKNSYEVKALKKCADKYEA